MPASNVLHEADAFAFDRVGQNDGGSACAGLHTLQRLHHLGHVVAVDAAHFPAEAAVLVGKGLDVHDFRNRAINLKAVAIHNPHQVVQLVVAGFHCRFPDLSLLLFAVAHEAERPVVLAAQFAGQCNAHGNAEPLAEGTGRDLDPGQLQPMWMSLEGGAEFA